MNAIETLISVLCGPEGKCCISGSDDDRRLIDSALADLAQAADSVQEDAARWNAWASCMVEACNSDEQEPAFLVALDKAIGDAKPPITLELLNEWTDAARKQGENHDR